MAQQSGTPIWFFEGKQQPADPPQWMKDLEQQHGAMMLEVAAALGDYAGAGDLKAITWFGIMFQRFLDRAVSIAEGKLDQSKGGV